MVEEITPMKKKKVALLFICLNPLYWPYLKSVISDCDKLFLTNRRLNCKVDYFAWTDMPEGTNYGATIFPTESMEWPMPTLMRFHLFLQQEEKLKKYDYIFYLDVDMRVVAPIGEEIMGQGLTIAEHPMYSFRREYVAPVEPNKSSTAFIDRFGVVATDREKQWYKPLYAAGGFQGGEAKAYIKAMKEMRQNIDKDISNNYIAIWNDESHWNKYLSTYEGQLTVLSPSYVYPDSLIKEFYEPRWGRSYEPKIITLTKPFTVSKEGGKAVRELLGQQETTAEFVCPTCNDVLKLDGFTILKVLTCNGSGKPHETEMKKT